MSILGWNRRTKKTGRGSALPILLTAFMLAMALLPLVNPDEIAAKDDKPRINLDVKIVDKGPILIDIDPGEAQVTPTTTPIVIDIEVDDPDIDLDPEIEVMPTETIEIDPDLDITAVPDQPAMIFVNKHGCPAGYDAGGKSFYDLAADCQAASNGIGFGLSDGNGFVQQQATGDLVGSGVQFDGVAAGPYSILEQVPAGYAAPRVFCESTMPGEGGQGANFVEQQVLEGNQIFHLFESGEFYYCDWFNIPGDKPTLHLPPGTVLDIDGDLPVIDLPDCVDSDETVLHLPDGVEIDVERRELTVPSDLIDLTERDRVIIADRDAWTTTITLPEDVELIETEDGPAIVIPICDEVEEADAGGAISITKSSCPIGFDAYAADVYGLALDCNDPMADVTFLLSDGAQAIGQSTTDANGAAGFTGVPNAPLSIVEQVPAGYGEPIVYCILNSPSQPQPGETVQQTVLDGNQIFIDFPENGDLSCSWYNVPALDDDAGDGEGVISISKTACPIGFDAYAADIYDLAYNCSDPMPGVTFLLSDGASAIAASSTDANGGAGFNGVDTIPVSIVEQVPDGYDAPRVFCISNVPGDTQVGDTIEQQVLDGNQIFHLMEAGESLSCTWFNVPTEDGGEVIVHKYECPDVPGINSDMEAHLLDKGCQTLDGIDFTLAYGI
ncbi:MAG: hypothetical protein IT336_11475, partial [Thermomicrobiales bacterium]|nr:hypothetical protein [Thermomicrobiales bacterium]